MYKLKSLTEEKEFLIESGSHTIGRSSDCDVFVNNKKLSRVHAKIELKGDKLTISDLGSLNGTYLNNKKIEQTERLKHGDVIRVDNYNFFVCSLNKEMDTIEIHAMNDGESPSLSSALAYKPDMTEASISYRSPKGWVEVDRMVFKVLRASQWYNELLNTALEASPDAGMIIIVLNGQMQGRCFTFSQNLINEQISIGRSQDNTLMLKDPSVSGHHIQLDRTGESFTFTDLDSTNGVYVKDIKTSEGEIASGHNRLKLGNIELAIYLNTGEALASKVVSLKDRLNPFKK